mmetsp:Transcript_53044/g.168305  ORF Transcript_53044/g.168305 Transcript_53044/m.168305 type:complete len:241 (-) Transcript_53044:439-1161(-)
MVHVRAEELRGEEGLDCGPLGGLPGQALHHEGAPLLGVQGGEGGDRTLLDLRHEALDVEGLEGGPEGRELVEDAAEGPHVGLEPVRLVREDLRAHVVGRAHHALRHLILLEDLCEPEVPDENLPLGVQEHVAALEVSVEHILLVHVLQSQEHLSGPLLEVLLGEVLHVAAAAAQLVSQVAPLGKYAHDAHRVPFLCGAPRRGRERGGVGVLRQNCHPPEPLARVAPRSPGISSRPIHESL